MINPSLAEFREKAKQGNLIPVYKEILADIETPVSAFRKLIHQEYAFLLESVEGGEKIARYSFLGANPSIIFKSKGKDVQIIRGNFVEKKHVDDPLESLKQLLRKYKSIPDPNLPRFYGGAVGYLSYDMVRFMEVLPDKNPDDLEIPDAYFMFTDSILIFDHVQHKIKVVSNAHIENTDSTSSGNFDRTSIDTAYYSAVDQVQQLIEVLREPAKPVKKPENKIGDHKITSNFKKEEFETAVEQAKEYIRAGDIFQVVPAQRLETKISTDPFNIYRALRSINPSPYMYYLQFGDLKLAGSSRK